MKRQYPYVIREFNDHELGVKFAAECIEYPGLAGLGNTVEEAASEMRRIAELFNKVAYI